MAQRLYYTDSFVSKFHARVTDVREVSHTAGQTIWQLALNRSAFYPTSGGQPFDTGSLVASSRSGATIAVPVFDVQEDESGELWHSTAKPLAAGTEVEASIDWIRRFDHMQQHSGQHLLSAIFAAEEQANTVSFHLGAESSTIDLACDGLSSLAVERVERLANEIIAEDRPISAATVTRVEAEALLNSGRLRKLPERAGDMRLIAIDNLDLNACGGTHLRSTGQIAGLLLRSLEKVRHGVRVEFVCGQRAVTTARRDHALVTNASTLLSVGPEELPMAVERMLAEAKASGKEKQKLRVQLAGYQASRLVAEYPVEEGMRVVQGIFEDRDVAYCKLLATQIAAEPQTVALIATNLQDPTTMFMACSEGLRFSCGDLLRAKLAPLGLGGGGSSNMAQGQVPTQHLQMLLTELAIAARAAK